MDAASSVTPAPPIAANDPGFAIHPDWRVSAQAGGLCAPWGAVRPSTACLWTTGMTLRELATFAFSPSGFCAAAVANCRRAGMGQHRQVRRRPSCGRKRSVRAAGQIPLGRDDARRARAAVRAHGAPRNAIASHIRADGARRRARYRTRPPGEPRVRLVGRSCPNVDRRRVSACAARGFAANRRLPLRNE